MVNGGNRRADILGVVERYLVVYAHGEFPRHFVESLVDVVHRIDAVRPRELVYAHAHARHPVHIGFVRICVRTELDCRNVLKQNCLAVGRVLDDDVFELLGRSQTPLRVDDKFVRDVGICERRLVELARRNLPVLRPDGGIDFERRYAEVGEFVGVEPHAHTVFALAENVHVADAVDAREPVDHLRDCVVGQIQLVAAAVRRVQVGNHEHIGRALFDGDAYAADFLGESRLCDCDSILYENLRRVDVCPDFKCHCDCRGAVGVALAGHVHHIFDAVNFLFERRDGCVHKYFRRRPRIVYGHGNGRRDDVRVLGYGQTHVADYAHEGDYN